MSLMKIYQPHELPEMIGILPLDGVVMFPGYYLPLNIFEERYRQLVDMALQTHRLIGVIQPMGGNGNVIDSSLSLYPIGTLGRITGYEEMRDGRYTVQLGGVCRFRMIEEKESNYLFRHVHADYSEFNNDLQSMHSQEHIQPQERLQLISMLQLYLSQNDKMVEGDVLERANDEQLVNGLCQICPFEPAEKQALLEAMSLADRAAVLMALLNMAMPGELSRQARLLH